ncbi:DUF4301 family protein [Marixanthomonas spongiae]|uniref:DUF4301 domain-containing protein n=1 Tax=Marixanthomonas spongiae TaxID=2174845 RepID=A0A2U0I2M2_9FLAO|nr:DUF4301 family protein [Marixanthomonas spongiae]PVW15356.1 DUF4301 domain-containing protein [Marixanthomonas spongiae]
MLNKEDVKQIEAHGHTVESVARQMETFAKGIPFSNVITTASVGNGIEAIPLSNSHSEVVSAGRQEETQQQLIQLFETEKTRLELVKFVPASGAATRMFKFLFQFLAEYNPDEDTLNKYIKKGKHDALKVFMANLKNFAFVNEVRKKIRELYPDYKTSKKGQRAVYFVKSMLQPEGLGYKNLPKGLIPFHKYKKYYTTAFEEQLYEAAYYASAKDNAYLHFTFSEAHVSKFKKTFEAVKNRLEKATKTKFHISYSFQKKETDTLAVTKDNKPFRDVEGRLVFRPSGHGALLENLNEVNADIVFIKNIDNVIIREHVTEIAQYKKLLAGKLIWLQQKSFGFLEKLAANRVTDDELNEIRSFLWNHLNCRDLPETREHMFNKLNRPLRVCGVVKNTGAPGGGPFWVKNEAGETTLQIVETAQIDMEDPHQKTIVNEATHFNPVDLVCGIRDFKGKKFDLKQFSDPDTGFISLKSQNGKPLKALELPGLWNGAMAKWNSVFVEVPLITFNPVKTVNDLLQPNHRPNK